MEICKHRSRYYLFKGEKRIKMIPEQFSLIPASILTPMLNDLTKIRLNNKERFTLNYYKFLQDLKINEKYLYDLINESEPILAINVNLKIGESRKELKFKNGYRVKIPLKLFNLFEEKSTSYSYY